MLVAEVPVAMILVTQSGANPATRLKVTNWPGQNSSPHIRATTVPAFGKNRLRVVIGSTDPAAVVKVSAALSAGVMGKVFIAGDERENGAKF